VFDIDEKEQLELKIKYKYAKLSIKIASVFSTGYKMNGKKNHISLKQSADIHFKLFQSNFDHSSCS